MIEPPIWSAAELDADRSRSEEVFRQRRMTEPLERYLAHFETSRDAVVSLLEQTVDLASLTERAGAILGDATLLDAVRYVTAPPVSVDDWKVVAEASLSRTRWAKDPAMLARLMQVIRDGLDRRRFPWIREQREASEAERDAAILATAALLATRKAETERRGSDRVQQEGLVAEALRSAGWRETPPRPVQSPDEEPGRGCFTRESLYGKRKADFIVHLHDGRVLLIECKVSNSSTNSVKRLNNDAAAKAAQWLDDHGRQHVVPAAVLAGVYKLHNLLNAQQSGLCLFWSHRIEQLTSWIVAAR